MVYLSTKYLKLRLPCKKLGPKYIGPFRVQQVINPVTVRLQLPHSLSKVHLVFHSSLLKLAVGLSFRCIEQSPGPIGGNRYEIREILDSCIHRGHVQYFVRWKGYAISEASWVGEADVAAPRLLRRYHHKYPHKPGGKLTVSVFTART